MGESAIQDKIALDKQKADEIKAVMRDRTLSRKEQQAQIADIKEKYANMYNNTDTDVDAGDQNPRASSSTPPPVVTKE